jgi:serine/threonine protein kinase
MAMDMWSLGCIFGEILVGKPIFSGSSVLEMLELIFKTCGTPTEKTWKGLSRLDLSFAPRIVYPSDFRREFFSAAFEDLDALDFLQSLLCLDPGQRITSESALLHPYLQGSCIVPPEYPHSFEMSSARRGSIN